MLRQRIITAVILALITVGCLVQEDPVWTRLLFTLLLLAASAEMVMLTLRASPVAATAVAIAFAALFWWSGSLINPQLVFLQSLAGVVLWLLIALGLFFYRHSGNWPLLGRVLLLGISLDLVWICAHGLVHLQIVYGGAMLFYMLSLVWIADIGAYFSGKRFGRNKLAPAISPGKTREGLLGGLLANLAWISLVYWFSDGWGLALVPFLLIGVATSLVSVIGDLFVSVLKREAGVKDSSKLLPGHGGVLDRVDSVIAATPVFLTGTVMAGYL